jgi:anti-sigma factor RsiW
MSDCRRVAAQLTPFVDRELPERERAVVQRHLDRCPPCQRAAADEERARAALRHAAPRLVREPLPPGLLGRCEALALERHTPRRVPWWQRRLVATFASACLVLATAIVIVALATRRSDVLLVQQLALDHQKCLMLSDSGDIVLDAADAERRLREHYGWIVHVPPSSLPDGVRLVGARRCLYAGGTLPHLMYRVDDEDVSLFMVNGERRGPSEFTTLGYHSHIWSQGAWTYVMISAGASRRLSEAARYMARQVR